MIALRYEGLRELLQSLRVVQAELYATMVAGLKEVGEVVRKDARRRFIDYGISNHPGRATGFVKAADGLQTLVRPNTSTMALVSVGQTLRSSRYQPRRRPNFGDLMMRHSLLPARGAGLVEAEAVMDETVGGLLARNGF